MYNNDNIQEKMSGLHKIPQDNLLELEEYLLIIAQEVKELGLKIC
jgi:hypothetical protein